MGISYQKLRELLVERGIQRKVLIAELKFSSKTTARINQDKYLDMETLEIIARYLNVNIGDIISLKD